MGIGLQPSGSRRRTERARSAKPLDDRLRSQFEPLFGFDFSHVRIHSDDEAKASAAVVGAQAYTQGNDIFMGDSVTDLSSSAGKLLLAHELAHTVQQRNAGIAPVGTAIPVVEPGAALERDAGQAAGRVVAGKAADVRLVSGPAVARQVAGSGARRVPLTDQNAQREEVISEDSAEFKEQYIDNNIDHVEYFSTGEAGQNPQLRNFQVVYKNGSIVNFSLDQFTVRFRQNTPGSPQTVTIGIAATRYTRVGLHIFPDILNERTVPRLIDIATTIAFNQRQRRQFLRAATVTFHIALVLAQYAVPPALNEGRVLSGQRRLPFPERRVPERSVQAEAGAAAAIREPTPDLLDRIGKPSGVINPGRAPGNSGFRNPPGTVKLRGEPLDVASLDPNEVYLWVVDEPGNFIYARENIPGFDAVSGRDGVLRGRQVKHGDLVPGEGGDVRGVARIGGELHAQIGPNGEFTGIWEMNPNSSYSFLRTAPPIAGEGSLGIESLGAVRDLLARYGTDVSKIKLVPGP